MNIWVIAGAVGVMSLGTGAARAAHILVVTEAGGPAIPIVDNGPLDSDIISAGVISVNTAALNALLSSFRFDTLSSVSDPLGVLTQSGTANRIGGPSSAITITAFDSGYLLPAGNPKSMTTAAADSFMFTASSESRTFQSFFDPTNSSTPLTGTASPLLVFVPPIGVGPFATSNSVNSALGGQPVPYSLSNTTTIMLNQSTAGTPQDVFSGTTTINVPGTPVVPLPSAALGGSVLLVVGMLARGRRRA